MLYVWNVTVRDSQGGVRAEFAIHAATAASALRETAPNLVGADFAHTIRVENCGLSEPEETPGRTHA